MNSSGDFDVENFQSLIENYEAALKDVTGELDVVQAEQATIKGALSENSLLTLEIQKILADKSECNIDHTYKEAELIENLKLQLKAVNDEKDQAVKLWQNAADTVEFLEHELKLYEENTQGLIPKAKLTELKNSYEEKLNELQATVAHTKLKLEETINLKSKELHCKDKDISGTGQIQNRSKAIEDLEDEVITLKKKLNEANDEKRSLQKDVSTKDEETKGLRLKVTDCKNKVQEALQVVEAALMEKDAALLREAEAKEEVTKLSQTLNKFIEETDGKIKNIKCDHEMNVEQLKQALQTNQEIVKIKELELENTTKKCILLEMEIEKIQNNRLYSDESATSKMLILEKNLENTFQKLLLSEKQNIQLKCEMDSIKNDLDQMSHVYERDVNTRETEKAVLRNEVKKLTIELDENQRKITQKDETIKNLNEQISALEGTFKTQLQETKNSFQQTCMERQEMENVHKQIVQELQEQLQAQTEINKKWRSETKTITEQLEHVITELKASNNKIRQENKMLHERLKQANVRMYEYRKFLETISQDVTKITNMTIRDDVGDIGR